MKILFILQNAYKSVKYNFRNEEEWYRDLKRSHTGRRLQEMIPLGFEIFVINASPKIGKDATSCFKADLKYLESKIHEINPDILCACGRIAQNALHELNYKFISAPHPAWRALSKEKTRKIRSKIRRLYG